MGNTFAGKVNTFAFCRPPVLPESGMQGAGGFCRAAQQESATCLLVQPVYLAGWDWCGQFSGERVMGCYETAPAQCVCLRSCVR